MQKWIADEAGHNLSNTGADDISVVGDTKTVRPGVAVRLQDREMVQSTVARAEAIIGAAQAFLAEATIELLAALDDDRDGLMRVRANLLEEGYVRLPR